MFAVPRFFVTRVHLIAPLEAARLFIDTILSTRLPLSPTCFNRQRATADTHNVKIYKGGKLFLRYPIDTARYTKFRLRNLEIYFAKIRHLHWNANDLKFFRHYSLLSISYV
jgi:hypothetical protein